MQKYVSHITKKQLSSNIKYIILFLFFWFLAGFSSDYADYEQYESYYARVENKIVVSSVEPGYVFLNKMAVSFGLSYKDFLKIYTFIAFILITSVIKRYTKSRILVLLMYFCYPFFLDIAQIRHLMMSAIILYSLRYLEKYSVKNLVKYLICVILAMSIHVMASVSLLFILSYIKNEKKLLTITVASALLFALFIDFVTNIPIIQGVLSLRGGKDYSTSMNASQALMYAIFYASLISSAIIIWKRKGMQNDFLFRICLCSIIFIPAILIDFQYTRLFRSIIIIIYIYVINGLTIFNPPSRKIVKWTAVALMSLVWIKLFGPSSGYYDYLTLPILTNCSIFNM